MPNRKLTIHHQSITPLSRPPWPSTGREVPESGLPRPISISLASRAWITHSGSYYGELRCHLDGNRTALDLFVCFPSPKGARLCAAERPEVLTYAALVQTLTRTPPLRSVVPHANATISCTARTRGQDSLSGTVENGKVTGIRRQQTSWFR